MSFGVFVFVLLFHCDFVCAIFSVVTYHHNNYVLNFVVFFVNYGN